MRYLDYQPTLSEIIALRHQFAGQALQGILANTALIEDLDRDADHIARDAFLLADKMLDEMERKR